MLRESPMQPRPVLSEWNHCVDRNVYGEISGLEIAAPSDNRIIEHLDDIEGVRVVVLCDFFDAHYFNSEFHDFFPSLRFRRGYACKKQSVSKLIQRSWLGSPYSVSHSCTRRCSNS